MFIGVPDERFPGSSTPTNPIVFECCEWSEKDKRDFEVWPPEHRLLASNASLPREEDEYVCFLHCLRKPLTSIDPTLMSSPYASSSQTYAIPGATVRLRAMLFVSVFSPNVPRSKIFGKTATPLW